MNDFTVFIGEQASGKSTICKVINFCLGMRNDLIELLEMIRNDAYQEAEEHYKWLMKREKYKFIHFFGPTYNVSAFKINFRYGSGNSIDIRLNDAGGKSFLHLDINHELKKAIWPLINESKQQVDYYKEMRENAGISSFEKRIEIESRKDTDRSEMIKRVVALFGEERELIHMPSARSIPSIIGFSSREISQILGEKSFIKPKFWLNPTKVDVYKLADGKISSIKSETELIYTERLDESLLNEMMQTFTSLGDMEDGNG